MLICPSCAHPNPESAVYCEACLTPLPRPVPTKHKCPNCGAQVQPDAVFCGNCGFNLKQGVLPMTSTPDPQPEMGFAFAEVPTRLPDPIQEAEKFPVATTAGMQLQQMRAALVHVQTNTVIELSTYMNLVHIGKPNNLVPPDVDVSGFPDSDIVSRVHADIRIEGGDFYIEDTGSSNGTYVNNLPLPVGNRYKLRHGDRIALGKGDKVSFIFQIL